MRFVTINSVRDWFAFIRELGADTARYLETPSSTWEDLEEVEVKLTTNLVFSEALCLELSKINRFFRGTLDGNNFHIICDYHSPVLLFSTAIHSTIKNLELVHRQGSHGLRIADDLIHCNIEHITVLGAMGYTESTGLLATTASGCTFDSCEVDAEITLLVEENEASSETNKPNQETIGFGGLVYRMISPQNVVSNTNFLCSITGQARVGCIAAIADTVKVRNSNFSEVTIAGDYTLGILVGILNKEMIVEDCCLVDCCIVGSVYAGGFVGQNSGTLVITNSTAHALALRSDKALTYAGGVCGTAKEIIIKGATLEVFIEGSFILAGVCPDSCYTEINDISLSGRIHCAGFNNYKHHAYKVVRNKSLHSGGNSLSATLINVDSDNLKITIDTPDGTLDQFKEEI